MTKFWSHFVSKLDPYIPGEQPQKEIRLKLNTNENPFPPSPLVLDEITNFGIDKINLYPDPESNELCEEIAKYHHLSKNQVFVGNGSDEILAFIFYGLFKNKKNLFFPNITYSFYPVYAKLFDIDYETIPLDDNFKINLSDYHHSNSAVIFPNPNAPTSIPLSLKSIENLVAQNESSIIVIDEAYVDFGTESAITLINNFSNILVTRSMSKSRSLAGLRVGYAVGSSELIDGLKRVKNSFNSYPVDRIAQKASIASFKDDKYFKKRCNQIIEIRENFSTNLQKLGFQVFQSGGNFVFTRPPSKNNAEDLYVALKNSGILVRFFKEPKIISSYLRITIGTSEQMDLLLSELKKLIDQ